MKTIAFILLLGLVGLIAGYLLFGKVGGSYVQITTLLKTPQSGLARLGQRMLGVEKVRENILIAGGVGAAAGLLLGLAGRRSRR